jgi:hypothetical protein
VDEASALGRNADIMRGMEWTDLDEAYLDIFGEHPDLVARVIDLASARAERLGVDELAPGG